MSDTKALYGVVADALANWGNGEAMYAFEALMGRLKDAEKERSEDQGVIAVWRGRTQRAEADNAALLKAIHSAYRPHAGECRQWDGATGQQVRPCPCGLDVLLDAEHPGAALLEEVDGLRHTLNAIGKALGFSDGAEAQDELVFAVENAKKVHEATQAALESALKDAGALNRRVGFLEEREAHARDAAFEEAATICDNRRYECGCAADGIPVQCRHCDEAQSCADAIRKHKTGQGG